MVSRTPERVLWAVELLDPAPDEQALEIGCGPGVAAALVCARLRAGRMLAIDRSPVAVRRAAQRNADHVAAGRLEIRQAELAALDVEPERFDCAFAVNVNLFWVRDPRPELSVLRNAVRPGGRLHLVYDTSGPARAERVVAAVTAALTRYGFSGTAAREAPAGIAVTAFRPRSGRRTG